MTPKFNFELERIDGGKFRLYKTPEGKLYPSVTSVLGSIPNPSLNEWRERVGDEVANDISRRAANRGTLIHNNIENFLLGKERTFDMFDHVEESMFDQLVPTLKKIRDIQCIEGSLWSDKLQVAGSVDLIAELDGTLSVIDWKTSSRYKSRDDIHSYFMQTAAYAFMFFERTGIAIDSLKIFMLTPDDGILEFEERARDWIGKFTEVRKAFDANR